MDLKRVELIARGRLIGPRGALLCRPRGGEYSYLPGGHIEFGEPAAVALARELDEELGVKVKVEGFLGAVECSFVQKGKPHHEVNLVLTMSSGVVARRAKLEAREPDIEFFWQPVHALAEVNVLPKALRALVPQWSLGKHDAWMSAMEWKPE